MKKIMATLTVFTLVFAALPVRAQGLSLIRDTEIERTMEQWIEPVLKQAGLTTDQVQIALVNSNDVNAFVAGGSNIFIYAGLMETADYPEEVIGVIAHEIGHIEGGHLIETRRAAQRASYQSILAAVAGIGAAVATGDGSAIGAVAVGGSGMAMNGYLAHSRTQESSADQAALRYLEGAKMNPEGLVSFLEKLEGQELLPASQQSQYMRTHPLTRDRIDAMRIGAQQSQYKAENGTSSKQQEFDFIRAKLRAFREPNMVPRYYNINSGEDIDIYANAIMKYRQNDYQGALDLFDQLIVKHPSNPYFHEMKAQTLRDSGQLALSETSYKKALSLLGGKAPLIETALAHIMIEQQKNGPEVENYLLSSLQEDTHDPRAYRLLATLKGRQGKETDAQYYLAEEAISLGRKAEAQHLLALSIQSGNLSNDLKVKAQDLKIYLDSLPNNDN